MQRVQRLATSIVGRVLSGQSLDACLADTWKRHPALIAQERGAIQDVAYGALRFRGRLECTLAYLQHKPIKDITLRHVLLVALYQLIYTHAPPHAVVDHSVAACAALGYPHARGLINAILRNYLRQRAAADAAAATLEEGRYSYPQWWISKLAAQYPQDYPRILEAGNARPPLTLRVNRRQTTRAAYLDLLARAAIDARPVGRHGVIIAQPRPVSELPGFSQGLVSVQDAGAQLAAEWLDVRDDMRVLDACAAPGGKSAHVLELATVDLTAADIDALRLLRVADNLSRLSLRAHLVQADAGDLHAWQSAGTFERILADVPCTASGVVRRHPDIKWLRKATDIPRFAMRQSQILDTLWQLLRGGGKLLYATCSVFNEENRLQIEQFVARHSDAQQLPLALPADGITIADGQLLPDVEHDGFFYTLLQKA